MSLMIKYVVTDVHNPDNFRVKYFTMGAHCTRDKRIGEWMTRAQNDMGTNSVEIEAYTA